MTATRYEKYGWGSADEAMQHTGESYEKYFVPTIGVPSARLVIDALGLEEGERVLDVACGTGVAARLAAEQVGTSGTVVGVDPTPPMLAVARRTSEEIDWRAGTAEDLPVDDESFDAVVCSISFQFFDQETALAQMRRVLAPGGRVAIGTPGPTPPLMAAVDKALTTHIGPEVSMFVERVFSVHDPDQVRPLLDAAGFEDVTVDTRPLTLRLPPPADFFWQYVQSTPLAGIAAELDDDTRAALERDVVERCQEFVEGAGVVMESGLLVATARRS